MSTESRCRSGQECAGKTDDGSAIVAEAGKMCGACGQDIQRRLDELPHLSVALRTMVGASMKASHRSKVRASPTPSIPINVEVLDLLDDIWDARATPNVADFIHDDVDRALWIRKVHKKAQDMVGFHPRRQEKIAPCPQCNKKKLGWWTGGDLIDCSECDMEMSLIEYQAWCYALTEGKK